MDLSDLFKDVLSAKTMEKVEFVSLGLEKEKVLREKLMNLDCLNWRFCMQYGVQDDDNCQWMSFDKIPYSFNFIGLMSWAMHSLINGCAIGKGLGGYEGVFEEMALNKKWIFICEMTPEAFPENNGLMIISNIPSRAEIIGALKSKD